MGRRFGYGATHSQSPEAFFLHVPGLKVVAPADADDAYAMLRGAIRDPDPVLFFEHKLLYDQEVERPSALKPLPPGRGRLLRRGSDLTILAYSRGVALAMEAAAALLERGCNAEVIDLRSLAPLDSDLCVASVKRTGRLLIVAEDCDTGGVASVVQSRLSDEAFEFLRGPVTRVSAADTPVPSGRELEDAVMVSATDIVNAALKLQGSW